MTIALIAYDVLIFWAVVPCTQTVVVAIFLSFFLVLPHFHRFRLFARVQLIVLLLSLTHSLLFELQSKKSLLVLFRACLTISSSLFMFAFNFIQYLPMTVHYFWQFNRHTVYSECTSLHICVCAYVVYECVCSVFLASKLWCFVLSWLFSLGWNIPKLQTATDKM